MVYDPVEQGLLAVSSTAFTKGRQGTFLAGMGQLSRLDSSSSHWTLHSRRCLSCGRC